MYYYAAIVFDKHKSCNIIYIRLYNLRIYKTAIYTSMYIYTWYVHCTRYLCTIGIRRDDVWVYYNFRICCSQYAWEVILSNRTRNEFLFGVGISTVYCIYYYRVSSSFLNHTHLYNNNIIYYTEWNITCFPIFTHVTIYRMGKRKNTVSHTVDTYLPTYLI